MKYKLLASDMDGTLFGADYLISDENQSAIKDIVASGIHFILSTGRPVQAVKKFVNQLGIEHEPIIVYNGAMVLYKGEIIYNLTLEDEQVKAIAEEGHKRGTTMVCWANNAFYAEKNDEWIEKYKLIPNIEPIFVDDLSKVKDVTKFVWFNSPKKTELYHKQMKERFGGEINVHPTRVDFLEFVNAGCSKAIALDMVGKLLDVKPQEMIAVGDGFNDLAMLEYAGLSVAVDNACKEVKDRVDFITNSCDNNGVKALIDRFLLNEGYGKD